MNNVLAPSLDLWRDKWDDRFDFFIPQNRCPLDLGIWRKEHGKGEPKDRFIIA